MCCAQCGVCAAALCRDPPPGVCWATLFAVAQGASALAAACADDLAADMAASSGQVDCEAAHAEADAWQEGVEAHMVHEAEMDALHCAAGGWASEEEEWGAEGGFW